MKRPRLLIVLGIINLAYALGWAFSGISALLLLAVSPELFENNNPLGTDLAPMRATYAALESPVFKAYWAVNGVITLIAAGLLAVAGVGLLLAKPWGRKLSLIWAAAAVLIVAASIGMAHGYLMPALLVERNEPHPGTWTMVSASLMWLLLRWAYPVALMLVLPRPAVTEAIAQAGAGRGGPVMPNASDAQSSAAAPEASTPQAATTEPAKPSASTTHPPASATAPAPAAPQTWRDDPWNDPNAT